MNVLVIDDNGLHLKMCRILLQNLGHEVETLESLGELRRKAGSFDIPDAVLIDYRLAPGETGVDVLNYIKGVPDWKNARLIALTADVGERTMLESAGFDTVAFKPITENLLKEILV